MGMTLMQNGEDWNSNFIPFDLTLVSKIIGLLLHLIFHRLIDYFNTWKDLRVLDWIYLGVA